VYVGGGNKEKPSVGVTQTATQEVIASVMAAEAAKMARMAVGAFIDVFSTRLKADPDPCGSRRRRASGKFPDLVAPRAQSPESQGFSLRQNNARTSY